MEDLLFLKFLLEQDDFLCKIDFKILNLAKLIDLLSSKIQDILPASVPFRYF